MINTSTFMVSKINRSTVMQTFDREYFWNIIAIFFCLFLTNAPLRGFSTCRDMALIGCYGSEKQLVLTERRHMAHNEPNTTEFVG